MTADTRHEAGTRSDLELADDLGVQLVRFMRLVQKMKATLFRAEPDGMERAAYPVLFALVHDGPQRASWLADVLHSEISTISRQTQLLVQRGLLERRADPVDGRACLLAPTAEGVRLFEQARERRNSWLAEVVADWSEQDRTTLSTLLTRLNTDIETNFLPIHTTDKGV
jgi:DNA-binding MarR family transcriptional regulator